MKSLIRILAFAIFFSPYLSWSQTSEDKRLAMQFYQMHDYEKAELLLKKQYDLAPSEFFEPLFKTYIQVRKYNDAILIAKQQLKGKESKNIDLRFKLGYAYYKNNDSVNSKKEWQIANELAVENEYEVNNLIMQYRDLKQWKMAEEIILLYQKKSKKSDAFNTYLLEILSLQGKYDDCIALAINILDKTESNYISTLNSFQFLAGNTTALRSMEKKVFSRLNTSPNSEKWNEVAMSLSLSVKDYEQAMILAKSFEKRNNNTGSQVFSISEIAFQEGEYDIAIDGFDYISKLPNSMLARQGADMKLNSIYQKLKKSNTRDSVLISKLNLEFKTYFSKFNFDQSTATSQLLYAEFNIKYLRRLDEAVLILERLIGLPSVFKEHQSRAKIDLADVKLALNEIWESSLLYGQVDKDEKDSPLGEEARFKNSKIFYYNGDYELAEELLSILKSSTTELIANDALYLAVFIQDNMDGGNLEKAMKDISAAELLFYQNRPAEAFSLLESVKKVYPKSTIVDDILMLEGKYALEKENYTEAASKFKEIFESFSSSFIADRALYEWTKIIEEIEKNSEKAKENYLILLTKYKDSVYTTDARKRLRKLKGDKIDEEAEL